MLSLPQPGRGEQCPSASSLLGETESQGPWHCTSATHPPALLRLGLGVWCQAQAQAAASSPSTSRQGCCVLCAARSRARDAVLHGFMRL